MAVTTETQSLIDHLGTLSFVGIFFASVLSNVVIPVPEEIVVIAFGYLIGTGTVPFYIVIPLIIAGMMVSDIIMYWLARNQNKLVTGFYNKFFSKLVGDRKEWLEARIPKVIFFSRFLIQLRFIGPFMAGQTRTKWKTFLAYDILALMLYVPFYTFIGWYFRSKLGEITKGVSLIQHLVILAVITLVIIAIGKLISNILFKGYRLSFKGKKHEQTWFSFLYLRKPKKNVQSEPEIKDPAS